MNTDTSIEAILGDSFGYLFEKKLLKEIGEVGQMKQFPAQQTLIHIGDTISHMPLVLEGSIKIMTEDKDQSELLLYYLELGDTCAVTLNCCTTKAKSSIRAVTETETSILFIPVSMMEKWMIHYSSWRAFVLESYNSRLNEMLLAIDNLVFNNLEERVYNYLRDKAIITKSKELVLSHQNIADDLHSSRVVISRIMKKLENNHQIKQGRNRVELMKI